MESQPVAKEPVEPRRPPPRDRFGELLRRAVKRPAGPRAPRASAGPRPAVSPPRSGQTTGERRCIARAEMDEAATLRFHAGARATDQTTARLEAGAEAGTQASARLEERARALLAQAVCEAGRLEGRPKGPSFPPADEGDGGARPGGFLGPDLVPPERTGSSGVGWAPRRSDATDRAMELVERVETFLRSGRPSLSLTLRGTMAGRVEVQRVAAGTVSLRFEAVRRPEASEVAAVETALRARGLTVQAMEILPLSPAAD